MHKILVEFGIIAVRREKKDPALMEEGAGLSNMAAEYSVALSPFATPSLPGSVRPL